MSDLIAKAEIPSGSLLQRCVLPRRGIQPPFASLRATTGSGAISPFSRRTAPTTVRLLRLRLAMTCEWGFPGNDVHGN